MTVNGIACRVMAAIEYMPFTLRKLWRSPKRFSSPVRHLRAHCDYLGRTDCPLVLISQIGRSGGTFLSQLFDHHPQLWSHPHELNIGKPKWCWPELSAHQSAKDAFAALRQRKFADRFYRNGFYSKGSDQLHPILFDAKAHEALFIELCDPPPATNRAWLDRYFASFFAAWLDYQRRYTEKRFITAFASTLALSHESMARFQRDYPDGFLISISREPLGWYASVKKLASRRGARAYVDEMSHYAGFEQAEERYIANVEAMHRNRALFGERLILLDYDALSRETETTMRNLANLIGIDYHPILIKQTFNGVSTSPNTSFPSAGRADALTPGEVVRIEQGPLMEAYRTVRSTV
jgi:Sulfotransferase family